MAVGAGIRSEASGLTVEGCGSFRSMARAQGVRVLLCSALSHSLLRCGCCWLVEAGWCKGGRPYQLEIEVINALDGICGAGSPSTIAASPPQPRVPVIGHCC